MRRVAPVLTLMLAVGCAQPTVTPEPTPTPPPTETLAPPAPTRRPDPTTAPTPVVPTARVDFEIFLIDNFGTIGDAELNLVDATVTDLKPAGMDQLYVTIETFDLIPDGVFEESATDKRDFARRLVAAMDAYSQGRDWSVSIEKSYFESSPVKAGEMSATSDIFQSVADQYDAENGGFLVTYRTALLSRTGKSLSIAVYREKDLHL